MRRFRSIYILPGRGPGRCYILLGRKIFGRSIRWNKCNKRNLIDGRGYDEGEGKRQGTGSEGYWEKMIYCRFLHCNFGNLPSTKRHLPNSYCEPFILLLYCRKLQYNRSNLWHQLGVKYFLPPTSYDGGS